jgi:hypothetical protein
MKAEMRHRFVPPNYTWSLYDKLTNLKQGLKPVDEYYQEMELIMQRAKVHELVEQTIQHFLSGLTYQIRRLFTIIRIMTWLSCCTRRMRPKLQSPRKLNLRVLLQQDPAFLHGHHQLASLLLVHEIQRAWEALRRPQLPSQAHMLPSPWRSLP